MLFVRFWTAVEILRPSCFLFWRALFAQGDTLPPSPFSSCAYAYMCFWWAVQSIFFLNSKRYRTMLQDSFSGYPDLSTSLLHSLYWLPIEQRIEYKVSLLCFKIISHQAPISLSKLLHLYTPSWQLCSSADTQVFRIPSCWTKSSGQCSFSYQASVIWN